MTWLDELKARLEAATPGPWKPNSDKGYWDQWLFSDQGDQIYIKDADAELIAHAPTDLAKAIRIIEIYEKALKEIGTETETNTNFSRAEDEAQFYIDIAKATLAEAEKIKGE